MRRKILFLVLGSGAVLGFAWGIHALRCHGGGPWGGGPWHGPGARHAAFENHVAEVCARAAERVYRERDAAPGRPAP